MGLQVQENRLQRQIVGGDNWKKAKDLGLSHSNGWGTWWWETGVGKTFATLLVCLKMLEKNNASIFIIIVPGEELEKQWKNSLKDFIPQKYHQNFQVITVHKIIETCKTGKRYICNMLIADELHEYYTDERLHLFYGNYIVTNYCLGLTATYEDINNRYKKIQSILPVVDRIDIEEATKNDYISKYIEYNVAVSLTDEEQSNYKALSDMVAKNLSKFNKGGLELAGKILQGDTKSGKSGKDIAYAYASHNGWRKDLDLSVPSNFEIMNLWSPSKVIGYAKLLMDNVRERKDLIYKAINKIDYAKNIVIKFDTLKTICFSQSTNFADYLANVINKHYKELDNNSKDTCVVYHSKLNTIIYTTPEGKEKKKGKTVLKREAIEAIKSGSARIISTASSLDRGFDVKDIRLALTTSGTQNPTQYSQRRGRAIRVENEKNDIVVLIINLYIRGTIEENWLRKRQAKSNNVVYWVDNIEDINYTPKNNDVFNLEEI